MPSSMIFAGLVVIWLLILVPAVARHRQEVARPSMAALSGRVLERPQRRQNLEVDVMDGERTSDDGPRAAVGVDDDPGYDDPGYDDPGYDGRRWERPAPHYRPGRGGYDPEAAAMTARARYGFRQRVVLTLLVAALITAVVAAVAVPGMWWPHAAVDLGLVGYLGYLRRQVRMEESIRDRRSARMAGTRRPSTAEDPELDEWAQRGDEATRDPELDGDLDDLPDADELQREDPVRVSGTGEPLAGTAEEAVVGTNVESALPRLQPAPPLALPAGTSLVETDDEDPATYDLDGPSRPDYRRAVGE